MCLPSVGKGCARGVCVISSNQYSDALFLSTRHLGQGWSSIVRILELYFFYMLKSRNDSTVHRIAWELQNGSFNQNLYGTLGNINIRNVRFDLTPFLSEFVTPNFLCYIFISTVIKCWCLNLYFCSGIVGCFLLDCFLCCTLLWHVWQYHRGNVASGFH